MATDQKAGGSNPLAHILESCFYLQDSFFYVHLLDQEEALEMQINKDYAKETYFIPTTRYALIQGDFWMSFCIIFSFASVYLLSKGFKNSQIGIIIAIAGLISATLQPIVADFADKSKRIQLRYIIAAFSVLMICLAGILLIPSLHYMMIAYVYGGLIAILQILTPLINAAGMECINRGIPVNFGLARGIGSILFAAISYIAGAIVSIYSTNVIPVMIIIFYILLFFSILSFHFVKRNSAGDIIENKTENKIENTIISNDHIKVKENFMITEKKTSFFREYKKFFILFIGITVSFTSHNILNNYMFQVVNSHGGGSTQMGVAMAIAAAVELPTMIAFSFLVSKIKSSVLLTISGIFFMIKSLLTFLAGSMMTIYIAQLSQAFGFALFVPASVYYVNHIMKEKDKVKGQAFMTVTNTAGSIVGSLAGGLLIDYTGVGNMLLVSTIIAFIGAIIIFFGVEHNK